MIFIVVIIPECGSFLKNASSTGYMTEVHHKSKILSKSNVKMHESWHDLGKVPSPCELLSYALLCYRNTHSPDRIRQFQDY